MKTTSFLRPVPGSQTIITSAVFYWSVIEPILKGRDIGHTFKGRSDKELGCYVLKEPHQVQGKQFQFFMDLKSLKSLDVEYTLCMTSWLTMCNIWCSVGAPNWGAA